MGIGADNLLIRLGLDSREFVKGMQDSQKRIGSIDKSVKGLGSTISNLKRLAVTAFAGWGIKQVAQSFLDASKEAEGYRIRLNTLLGSQKEGARAFKEMADYASRVPFEYREVMGAATALSGVMKGGVDEIKRWMPLIGDLAAVTGLSIQETTGQVIRMYSAGAASADLFRERGVLAMLGFTAGVSYSAEETRKKMFESWEATGSKFRGVTEELAKTWSGTMSMFGDLWFQFRNEVMDSTGAFDSLKETAQDVLLFLKSAMPTIILLFKETYELISDIWAVLSSPITGAIEQLQQAAVAAKELGKNIDNLSEPSNWAKLWGGLVVAGKNIIAEFVFIGKAFGETLALMIADAIAFVKLVADQFYNLGNVIWEAIKLPVTGSFEGLRNAMNDIVSDTAGFTRQLEANWQGMEQAIAESWDEMVEAMIRAQFNIPKDLEREFQKAIQTAKQLRKAIKNVGDEAVNTKIKLAGISAEEKMHYENMQEEFELYIKYLEKMGQKAKENSELDERLAEQRIKEWKEANEKIEADYKHMLENIQDKTADIFEDILTGSIQSWDDMLDIMWRLFVQWAAQIAAQQITFNVVQPLLGNLGMGGGVAGQAGGNMLENLMPNLLGKAATNLIPGGSLTALGSSLGLGTMGTMVSTGGPAGMAGVMTSTGTGMLGSLAPLAPMLPYLAAAAIAIPLIMSLFDTSHANYGVVTPTPGSYSPLGLFGGRFGGGLDIGDFGKAIKGTPGTKHLDDAMNQQLADALNKGIVVIEDSFNTTISELAKLLPENFEDSLGNLVLEFKAKYKSGLEGFSISDKGDIQAEIEKIFKHINDQLWDTVIPAIETSIIQSIAESSVSGLMSQEYINIADLVGSRANFESDEEYLSAVKDFLTIQKSAEESWSGINQTIDETLNPLAEWEIQLRNINNQFDGWIETLKQLGFSEAALAEIEAKRLEVIEKFKTDTMEGITTIIEDMLNPLEGIDKEIQNINKQFDAWIKMLEGMQVDPDYIAWVKDQREEVIALIKNRAIKEEAEKEAEAIKQAAEAAAQAAEAAAQAAAAAWSSWASAIGNAFKKGIDSRGFYYFEQSLYDSVYEQVFQGFVDALTQSSLLKSALEPLSDAVSEAMQKSFTGGVFNESMFLDILSPYLDKVKTDINALRPLFTASTNLFLDLQSILTGVPRGITFRSQLDAAIGARSYDMGTDWVPDDGWRYLHRGEAVLNPQENKSRETREGCPTIIQNHIYLEGKEMKSWTKMVADGHINKRIESGTLQGTSVMVN